MMTSLERLLDIFGSCHGDHWYVCLDLRCGLEFGIWRRELGLLLGLARPEVDLLYPRSPCSVVSSTRELAAETKFLE